MPDDNSPENRSQQALGKPRAVLTADGPMVALDEGGIVRLHKLHVVPDALWGTPGWHAPQPSWAANVEREADRLVAMIVELDLRRHEAIAELEILVPALRELRRLIKQSGDAAIVRRIDEIGLRARIILAELDKP